MSVTVTLFCDEHFIAKLQTSGGKVFRYR